MFAPQLQPLQWQIDFYERHYEIIDQRFVHPGLRITLGNKHAASCRFCRRAAPQVSFRKLAHAIPELLGNKSLFTHYECDECNEKFGAGIENDLGNWSKPMRTMLRIKGKKGVPTLKKGGSHPGWRVEADQCLVKVSAYEEDPIFEVDEVNKQVHFKLARDPYRPVAVLKAFMKIGISLLPEEEVCNFASLIDWIGETDHTRPYLTRCPVIYSFRPGPLPNELISTLLLRRRNSVTNLPYCFLVFGYANEVFQIPLPSEPKDRANSGMAIEMPPFPVPTHPDDIYGRVQLNVLDWTDRQLCKGELCSITIGYEEMKAS